MLCVIFSGFIFCIMFSVLFIKLSVLRSLYSSSNLLYYIRCIHLQTFCVIFFVLTSKFLCCVFFIHIQNLCVMFSVFILKITVLNSLYFSSVFLNYIFCIHLQNFCFKFSVLIFKISVLFSLYSSFKFMGHVGCIIFQAFSVMFFVLLFKLSVLQYALCIILLTFCVTVCSLYYSSNFLCYSMLSVLFF